MCGGCGMGMIMRRSGSLPNLIQNKNKGYLLFLSSQWLCMHHSTGWRYLESQRNVLANGKDALNMGVQSNSSKELYMAIQCHESQVHDGKAAHTRQLEKGVPFGRI